MVRKLSLFIFCLSLIISGVYSQIYAPGAAGSFSAAYNDPSGNDIIYIFNRPAWQQTSTDSIYAISPDQSEGWTFIWSVYNFQNNNYEILPFTGTGSYTVIDSITVSSGYRMVMSKGGISYTYRVWLLYNDFKVEITNKDTEGKLAFGYYNCTSLDLRADTVLNPLSYPKPFENIYYSVYNNYSIRWNTDNPKASLPANRLITRVASPPSEDTKYIITVTDLFGLQRKDTVLYESIQSEAIITASYVQLGDTLAYPGKSYGYYYSNNINSAPGKYRFNISGSKNSANFEIDFGDGQLYMSDVPPGEPIIHEYLKPGNYKAIITTRSAAPYECADSASVMVDLAYAVFALPNVFTPNEDGSNDRLRLYDNNNLFRSEDVSVLSIDISIYDRSGSKVHSYAGNIRDWQGWDGKVTGSNRNAPEGVYFYVISLLYSFEDPENPVGNEVLKGFFHLFRE